MKEVSYTALESTLHKLGAQLSAAETHGLLTGMLSLAKLSKNNPSKKGSWQTALLENLDCSPPNKSQWGVLDATSNQILAEFDENNEVFKLLLPNDRAPLSERIDALGYWCRGYLSGLGLVGVTEADLQNTVIKELIQDLSQIAHVSVETDADEEDEHNYMELVEYVRVAVHNIQLELKAQGSKVLH